jgi:hypothetical protein
MQDIGADEQYCGAAAAANGSSLAAAHRSRLEEATRDGRRRPALRRSAACQWHDVPRVSDGRLKAGHDGTTSYDGSVWWR